MSASEFPAPYVVEPRPGHPHTHTIIFLHGRDSDAREFADELFESEASPEVAAALELAPPQSGHACHAHEGAKEHDHGAGTEQSSSSSSSRDSGSDRTLPALLPTVRWIFPQAPTLPSARFGADMAQWFDMWTTEEPRDAEHAALQHPGLQSAVAQLLHTLDAERRYVCDSRIFVGGISQGCAVALAAFTSRRGGAWRSMAGLAGVVGLSSWMPLPDGEDQEEQQPEPEPEQGARRPRPADSVAWRTLPLMLQHCADDDVIAVAHGRHLRDHLAAAWGHQGAEWREYDDGGHWLNEPRGVDDVVRFLRRCMSGVREGEAVRFMLQANPPVT